MFDLSSDIQLRDILNINAVFSFVESAPEYILRYRNPKLCNPANLKILSKAELLQKKFVFLNNAVHLNRFTDSAKLRHYAKRIVNAGIFFFIDGEYHAAHKTWHTIKNFAKTNSDQ